MPATSRECSRGKSRTSCCIRPAASCVELISCQGLFGCSDARSIFRLPTLLSDLENAWEPFPQPPCRESQQSSSFPTRREGWAFTLFAGRPCGKSNLLPVRDVRPGRPATECKQTPLWAAFCAFQTVGGNRTGKQAGHAASGSHRNQTSWGLVDRVRGSAMLCLLQAGLGPTPRKAGHCVHGGGTCSRRTDLSGLWWLPGWGGGHCQGVASGTLQVGQLSRRPNEPAPRLLHAALALTALPFWTPPEAHTVCWVIFRVDGVGHGGPRLNMISGCVCEGISRRH